MRRLIKSPQGETSFSESGLPMLRSYLVVGSVYSHGRVIRPEAVPGIVKPGSLGCGVPGRLRSDVQIRSLGRLRKETI